MDVAATSTAALAASPARKNVDPKTAEAQAQKLKEQQQALQQLKAMPKVNSDNAKAHAKQRVDQVRQMLRQMKMLAAGNPKQMARQIAQLAKELAAAVKEYAQTTGGSAAAPNDGADMADAAKAAEPGAQEKNGEAAESSEEAQTNKNGDSSSDAAGQKQAADAYQKTGNDIQKQLLQSPDAKDKNDFTDEVRNLTRQLKEMAKAAKQSLTQHPPSKDMNESDAALTKLDKELANADAPSGITITGAVLNISA